LVGGCVKTLIVGSGEDFVKSWVLTKQKDVIKSFVRLWFWTKRKHKVVLGIEGDGWVAIMLN